MLTKRYCLKQSLNSLTSFEVKLLPNFMSSEAVTLLSLRTKNYKARSRENWVIFNNRYSGYKSYSSAFQEKCKGKRGYQSW